MIPPLRMSSLLAHDLCHGRSASRRPPTSLLEEWETTLHYSLTCFGVVKSSLNPIWKNRYSRLEHSLSSLLFKSWLLRPSGPAQSHLFGHLPPQHTLHPISLMSQSGLRSITGAAWSEETTLQGNLQQNGLSIRGQRLQVHVFPDERFWEASALFSGGHGTTGLLPSPPSFFDHLTALLLLPGIICQRKHSHPGP